LGIHTDLVDTAAHALTAIAHLTTAVTTLGNVQGAVGTGENDLQYAIGLAQSQITNKSAAESQIRDANIASAAADLTKSQVLQQSSVAALAQANAAPQALLKLLQ
jgi:flagellin